MPEGLSEMSRFSKVSSIFERHFSNIQKGITESYMETVMPFHYVLIVCCMNSRLFFTIPAVCAEIFYRNANRFQHIIQTIILQ